MTQGSNELHFFYDAQNKPAVVVYNGTPYTYVKNLQGDIVAILDSNGIAVVQYRYDAWGRQISCDVAAGNSNAAALSTLNPFRYRGYVYDEETELYYLRSRYYNPCVCRFINPDDRLCVDKSQSFGNNSLAYCNNVPVMFVDESGHMGKLAFLLCFIVSGNHGYNLGTSLVHNITLRDSYSIDEATTEINMLLSQYSEKCYVEFGSNGVEIFSSHEISNRETRQHICEIIARTGVTDREADNLSAEWLGHNLAYWFACLDIVQGISDNLDFDLNVIVKDPARNVFLDYTEDSREYVVLGTQALEILGFD